MNTPYVKKYDGNDVLTNPINGKYVNEFPNRQQRNSKPPRDYNNKKSIPTVIHGIWRYIKRLQIIPEKYKYNDLTGKWELKKKKTIIHYDLATKFKTK